MKTIILSIIFFSITGLASEGIPSSSEAAVSLNCDSAVPGSVCPSKYATGCQTILCDSNPSTVSSPVVPAAEGSN